MFSPPVILGLGAMLLLGLSMRIPTISLGPLLPEIRSDTGHGETFVSLLTTIPLALTLLVAPVTPRVAARIGRARVLGAALAAVVAGTVLRSIPGDAFLLAGTALLGVAIAVGTVLAPAAIAAEPLHRRAKMTASYSMALSLGPALALALTIPMRETTGFSWRATLMLWALCSVLALAVWIGYTRKAGETAGDTAGDTAEPAPADGADDDNPGDAGTERAARDESSVGARPVIADPRVWQLAVYLGITSLTFYTTSTWLPTTFVMDGTDVGTAGGFTSLINLVAIPLAMLAPILMRRGLSPLLAPLAPLIAAAGIGVLLTTGASGALAVALLMGVSQGLCLGVAYGQIVQFSTSPRHASSVSAVTSAVGIALAALGPLGFGFGLETSGEWIIPVGGLGCVLLIQVLVGLRTGRLADTHLRP